MERYHEAKPLPRAFIGRRLQSLMGLWLVIFLIEHLLTNSQAALPIGEDGNGFIRAVNSIKSLPYFHAIELLLIAVPFLVHMVWGVHYLFTSKQNSYGSVGQDPYLPNYARNHAYTWQRITSWILLILLISHVVHMRFFQYPIEIKQGLESNYIVRLNNDNGIYTLADRLGVALYDGKQAKNHSMKLAKKQDLETSKRTSRGFFNAWFTSLGVDEEWKPQDDPIQQRLREQKMEENQAWAKAFEQQPLAEGQLIAVAPSFGIAELLIVRETFKMPSMLILYTIFVLAAAYHGFNGLWTFCITWGVTLTARSQAKMRIVSLFFMGLIAFFGLAAIWGTYLINLNS